MGHLSSMFNGLVRSLSMKKSKNLRNYDGREAVEAMIKDAKKNDLILKTSGIVNVDGSNNLISVFSNRGEKGLNQDCCIVWEEFGCQADMVFCGVFDGHGPWGHFVAKNVRQSMSSSLFCHWQEAVAEASPDPNFALDSDRKRDVLDIWKHSYQKACAEVDQELEQHRKIDAFNSGTTALTMVRQADSVFLANVGDSRAVLCTTLDGGDLVAVQLTIDFKPNLPQEAERLRQCGGRVYCMDDEPGVYRVWLPHADSPGLAMSRAFGDFCVKDFGLTSVPDVTQWHVTSNDQFIVLATDGVWDVVSNEEAVQIVWAATNREKSAKRLVEGAVRAWKKKRKGMAMDDISAIVLFFHSSKQKMVLSFEYN